MKIKKCYICGYEEKTEKIDCPKCLDNGISLNVIKTLSDNLLKDLDTSNNFLKSIDTIDLIIELNNRQFQVIRTKDYFDMIKKI